MEKERLKILKELYNVEETKVAFSQRLADKNIEELQENGYNFETEDGE